MVLDTETLEPLHELSHEGMEKYGKYMERHVFYKSEHPFMYYWDMLMDKIFN